MDTVAREFAIVVAIIVFVLGVVSHAIKHPKAPVINGCDGLVFRATPYESSWTCRRRLGEWVNGSER